MPQFDKYEDDGRKLMIAFTCRRCKTTRIEELEPLDKKSGDHYGHLSFINPPEGWSKWDYNSILLCDGCTRKLAEFMKAGEKEVPEE